MNCDTICLAAL